jgi:hypothetical protein
MDFGRFYYTVVIYTLDSLFNFFPSCTFKGKVLPETRINNTVHAKESVDYATTNIFMGNLARSACWFYIKLLRRKPDQVQ